MDSTRDRVAMKAIERLARLKLSEFALSRFERLAVKIGIDENRLLELYIEAKNSFGRERFIRIPYSERILLLPQCLRPKDCPAKPEGYSYVCVHCGKCNVGKTISEAEDLGYKGALIISGGSVVPKVLAKLSPKGCLGVGCLRELVLGSFVCERYGVVGQGIPLLKDGCLETELDWDSFRGVLYANLSMRGG
ncbi:MAG: DUF116 domain-containing protein [Candidatus Bathyarchaeia archaeon]